MVIGIILSSLTILKSYASCQMPAVTICKGTFVADTRAKLELYNQSIASGQTPQKNLKLSLNIEDAKIDIISPCNINLDAGTSLKSTSGSICIATPAKILGNTFELLSTDSTSIRAGNSVSLGDNVTIDAVNDFDIQVPNELVIRNNAKIKAKTIALQSTGADIRSRSHIRSNAIVTAESLIISSFYRSTLGGSSTFNIANNLTMEVRGSDWDYQAALWASTNVTANTININSNARTYIGKGVILNTSATNFNGALCHISNQVNLSGIQKSGNCFDSIRPLPKVKTTSISTPGETKATFNAVPSKYLGGEILGYYFTFGDGAEQHSVTPLVEHTYLNNSEKELYYDARMSLILANGEKSYPVKSRVYVQKQDTTPTNIAPTILSIYSGRLQAGPPVKMFFGVDDASDADGEIKTFLWNFGDGHEIEMSTARDEEGYITHEFLSEGPHQIKVTAIDNQGGSSTYTSTIDVNNSKVPVAKIKADCISGSLPLTINFDGSESIDPDGVINRYRWTIYEDGIKTKKDGVIISHVFNSPGIHKVKLVTYDDSGGIDTTFFNIYAGTDAPINGLAPRAVFKNSTRLGSVDTLFSFDASLSYDIDGHIVDYFWNFGDYGSATRLVHGMTSTHRYSKPGTYQVELTAIDNMGNKTSNFSTIYVQNKSTTKVNPDFFIFKNHDYNFSFSADPNFFNYNYNPEILFWDMGDGDISNGRNIEHNYAVDGDYDISLVLNDIKDGVFDITKVLSLHGEVASPTAIINQDHVIAKNVEHIFDASSSIAGREGELKYFWSFGDGTVLHGPGQAFSTVKHTYQTSGFHDALLIVTNENNISDAKSFKVNITSGLIPEAAIFASTTTGVAPLLVQLDAGNSRDLDGEIHSYQWQLSSGDDTDRPIGVGSQLTYTFETPGRYIIKLTVIDDEGNIAESEQSIDVVASNLMPVASFSCSNEVLGAIECISTAYDPDGHIVSDIWYVDGIEYGQGNLLTFQFPSAGNFLIEHQVYDNEGNSSKESMMVFSDQEFCEIEVDYNFSQLGDRKYEFTANASSRLGTITTYNWTIDNIAYSGQKVTHKFSKSGLTTISLTAFDDLGNSKTLTRTLAVNSLPQALFFCRQNGDKLSCDASASNDSDGTITTYQWTFGTEAITTTNPVIEHFFSEYGDISVSLTAYDDIGATSPTIATRYKVLEPKITAIINCQKNELYEVTCTAKNSIGHGIELRDYAWSLSNGITYQGVEFTHNFVHSGDQNITLIVSNADIQNTASTTIELEEIPADMYPSTGKIIPINFDEKSFINSSQNIRFAVEDASFYIEQDENNEDTIRELSIRVNDSDFTDHVVDLNSQEFTLEGALVEGKNIVEIFARDSEGKILSRSFEIWAGSRIITFSAKTEDNMPIPSVTFSLFLQDQQEVKIERTVSDGDSFILENIPSMSFYILAYDGESKFLGKKRIGADDTNFEIILHGYDSETEDFNGDFEQGIATWNLKEGSWNVVDISNETNPILKMRSERKMTIKPSEQGSVWMRRTILISGEIGGHLVDFDFRPSSPDDYYLASLRNKTTNKVVYIFKSAKQLGIGQLVGEASSQQISIEASDGDIVEFDLFMHTDEKDESMVSYIFNLFAPSAYASYSNSTFEILKAISTRYFVSEGYLVDVFFDASTRELIPTDEKLNYLSLSHFQDYHPRRIGYEGAHPFANYVELKFIEPLYWENHKIGLIIQDADRENIITTHFLDNTFSLRPQNFVLINLTLTSSLQSIMSRAKIYYGIFDYLDNLTGPLRNVKPENGKDYFEILVPLSGERYSERRDVAEGGDDFIRSSSSAIIHDILVAGNFPGGNSAKLKFNDASNNNGGSFISHQTHKNGLDLDVKFDESAEWFAKYKMAMSNDNKYRYIHNIDIVNALVDVLDSTAGTTEPGASSYIKDIYTNCPMLGKTCGPASIVHQASVHRCLSNGSLASNYFVNKPGHGDHFHISFSDWDDNGKSYGKREPKFWNKSTTSDLSNMLMVELASSDPERKFKVSGHVVNSTYEAKVYLRRNDSTIYRDFTKNFDSANGILQLIKGSNGIFAGNYYVKFVFADKDGFYCKQKEFQISINDLFIPATPESKVCIVGEQCSYKIETPIHQTTKSWCETFDHQNVKVEEGPKFDGEEVTCSSSIPSYFRVNSLTKNADGSVYPSRATHFEVFDLAQLSATHSFKSSGKYKLEYTVSNYSDPLSINILSGTTTRADSLPFDYTAHEAPTDYTDFIDIPLTDDNTTCTISDRFVEKRFQYSIEATSASKHLFTSPTLSVDHLLYRKPLTAGTCSIEKNRTSTSTINITITCTDKDEEHGLCAKAIQATMADKVFTKVLGSGFNEQAISFTFPIACREYVDHENSVERKFYYRVEPVLDGQGTSGYILERCAK